MDVDVVRVHVETLAPFFAARERESLREAYGFPVVWHEAAYGFAVRDDGATIGAGVLRVAASLGEVVRLVVDSAHRRRGVGSSILAEMSVVANYYNCHKMTASAIAGSPSQRFFEACGYGVEATLAQHTFKLDVALLRKYLL